MARKNPTTSRVADDIPGLPGIKMPYPAGVNMDAQEDSEKMPEVNMTKNDGDQKDVVSPEFAVGKDSRNFPKQNGACPMPAKEMPGCN